MEKKVFTDPKQVIVARRDLMMPDGKLAAQVAHASVRVLLDMGKWEDGFEFSREGSTPNNRFILKPPTEHFEYWMRESFPKIVLGVDTEEEMEILYSEFQLSGLPCSKVIDSGRTVYNGVHNLTCIAIGPADRQSIDKITGHLPLYKPWDMDKEGMPGWMQKEFDTPV